MFNIGLDDRYQRPGQTSSWSVDGGISNEGDGLSIYNYGIKRKITEDSVLDIDVGIVDGLKYGLEIDWSSFRQGGWYLEGVGNQQVIE